MKTVPKKVYRRRTDFFRRSFFGLHVASSAFFVLVMRFSALHSLVFLVLTLWPTLLACEFHICMLNSNVMACFHQETSLGKRSCGFIARLRLACDFERFWKWSGAVFGRDFEFL